MFFSKRKDRHLKEKSFTFFSATLPMIAIAAMTGMVMMAMPNAAQAQEDMTFTLSGNGGNCMGCEWIEAKGRITKNSAQKFLAMQSSIPVILHSSGGDRAGAMKLGEAFRDQGISVSIGQNKPIPDLPFHDPAPGQCLDTCIWAFIGGINRSAQIGEIELPDLSVAGALDIALFDHVQDMGINPDILRRAMASRSQDRRLTNAEALEAYDLIYEAGDLQPWTLLAKKGRLIARSQSRDGMRHISYQCTKDKRRQLALREEQQRKSPYDMPLALEMITEVGQLDFAGRRFPVKVVKATDKDFVTEIVLDLPKNFKPSFAHEDLVLVNDDAPRYMRYYLALHPDGMKDSFAMVDHFCGVKR